MWNSGKRQQRFRNRVVADSDGARRSRCSSCILTVVDAADARLGRQRIVGRKRDPFEAETAWNDFDPRPFEDAQLRATVCLEAAVTIEMVRLEVQQHGDVAREFVHVLELEA
jgi:hypothetical protein